MSNNTDQLRRHANDVSVVPVLDAARESSDLTEGPHLTLTPDTSYQRSGGGRFAAFAGTLTQEEAKEMLRGLDREFGKIEGQW